MNSNNNKYLNNGIGGLLPVYIDGIGDTTLLIDGKGQKTTIHRKLRSVLKSVAGYFACDLSALRNKYGSLINQRVKVPLPVHPEIILVPFKTRIPKLKDDGAIGYINYKLIEGFNPDGRHSKVVLINGVEISVLETYATIQRNMVNADLVAKEYLSEHYSAFEARCRLDNFNGELSKPATRADIAFLSDNLNRLLQYLKGLTPYGMVSYLSNPAAPELIKDPKLTSPSKGKKET